MKGLSQQVATARGELGLTQGDLGTLAGTSLATVQNIEAGRANPSIGTLSRILSVLGMGLELRRGEADWDLLAALGIPLQRADGPTVQPSPELLHVHLRHALVELDGYQSDSEKGRRLEAVEATLYALKHHFPTYYARHFAKAPLARSLLSTVIPGRVAKLARVAADNLARYL